MKLAIGTAQFGLNYGVANRCGQVSKGEAKNILNAARELGIDMLDTAAAYGDSEACLGDLRVTDFQVVTKLPAWHDNAISIGKWVATSISDSLIRLQVSSVHGLLLHRPDQLCEENAAEIAVAINNAKEEGQISKFGVSIYDPSELEYVRKLIKVDIVQAPFNVFDRRLQTSGWLQELYDSGVEVHIRSVYLQGLLLMSIDEIPRKFNRWHRLFEQWHTWLEAHSIEPILACLAGVNDYRVSRVVIGVDNLQQLQQLVSVAGRLDGSRFPDMPCDDLDLINPSKWPTL